MEKGVVSSLIFAVIIGIFALKNGAPVTVDFIFTKVELSQSIVILISALLGAIIIFLITLVKSIKKNREIKRLEKELNQTRTENEELKIDLEKSKESEEEALDGLAEMSSEKLFIENVDEENKND